MIVKFYIKDDLQERHSMTHCRSSEILVAKIIGILTMDDRIDRVEIIGPQGSGKTWVMDHVSKEFVRIRRVERFFGKDSAGWYGQGPWLRLVERLAQSEAETWLCGARENPALRMH